MNKPIFGIAILLWILLGLFYRNICKDCCHVDDVGAVKEQSKIDNTAKNNAISTQNKSTADASKLAAASSGPILFNYGKDGTVLGDGWDSYKANLLGGLKDGERLEITGKYTSAEKAPKGFANMGEARADRTREALGLSKDRVLLKGVMSGDGVDKNNPYEAVTFRNVGAPKTVEETIDNKTIIRFPYNSTNKLSDSAVENYLDKVAKRVKSSGERVRLTGHTDADGSEASNMNLGQRRADIIKSYLVKQGVSASKILTSSKGESMPIASNSTASGKAENRRTELEIIK